MGDILTFATYFVCIVFTGRVVLHVLSWARALKSPSVGPLSRKTSVTVIGEIILDIILFRRLFRTNKLLWTASWTFHISLFLVIIRHLRYFMYPVPLIVLSVQDIGIYAGYVLPLSIIFLLAMRISVRKDRYVSFYNFYLLMVLMVTAVTGILLKLFYRTGLVDIKAFALGIVTFSPETLPGSNMFTAHFILVLMLIPFLPFHLITAPVITVDARRREEGLYQVIHEK